MKTILLFTSVLFLVFQANAATITAKTSGTTLSWSLAGSWTTGSVPTTGDEVIIPSGAKILLNQNVDVKSISVMGSLLVDVTKDISIQTEYIMVMGAGALFQWGTELNPYLKKGLITLVGTNPGILIPGHGVDSKTIIGMDGAVVDIHGKKYLGWTQLNATVKKDENKIILKEPVDWVIGQEIVISSTDYDVNQAEQMTITNISADKKTLTLGANFKFMHWGELFTYQNAKRNFKLDERAEVGLLSRNIKIQGDDYSETNGYGGHTMFMGGSSVQFSGVELYRMGQKSKLGRYPFHWHLAGEVPGQYIKNSSVHLSYNRLVTVHGSNRATVEDVVGYDCLGHGFFLENGTERRNMFKNNLGILSKAPKAGEEVRPHDREVSGQYFKFPAMYWITNPDNDFVGNVCGGSQGSGFWVVALKEVLEGTATYSPAKLPLGLFNDNRSHSTAFSNLGFDESIVKGTEEMAGGSYAPTGPPTEIYRFTGYKARERNVWTRALKPMYFFDCSLAESQKITFFAYEQTLINSLVCGRTANIGNPVSANEIKAGYSLMEPRSIASNPNNLMSGTGIYDGPSGTIDVHFADFDKPNTYAFKTNGAALKSNAHYCSGITFAPNTLEENKVDFGDQTDRGYMYSSGLVDLDGSVTGIPKSRIVPKIAQSTKYVQEDGYNREAGAILHDKWGAFVCRKEQYAMVKSDFDNRTDVGEIDMFQIRSDGPATYENLTYGWRSQNNSIANKGIIYYSQYQRYVNKSDVQGLFMKNGDVVYRGFLNVPSTANSPNGTRVNSLAELKALNAEGYCMKDNTLIFKLIGKGQDPVTIWGFDNSGSSGNMDVCMEKNCANALTVKNISYISDLEMGADSRAALTKCGLGIKAGAITSDVSNVELARFDNVDNKVSFTLTSNNDSKNDFVDYTIDLNRQIWQLHEALGIKFDGVGTIQVLIKDSNNGYYNLGHYNSADAQNIKLNTIVPFEYLDNIESLIIRIYESHLGNLGSATTKVFNLYEINLNGTAPSNYSVPATVAAGINTSLANCNDVITGLPDLEDFESFSVYPNPSSNGVFQLSKEVSWKVLNNQGIVILTGNGKEVNLSNSPEGVYFLQSSNGVQKIMLK